MKIALVSSRQDPGGCTIHEAVTALLSQDVDRPYPLESHALEVVQVEDRLIFQDNLDRSLDADLVIFLSRHSSVNPLPVLTVHVTGNLGEAAFGGRPGSLAPAAPAWMHAVLRQLKVRAPPGYRVAYEVTHHGPTELSIPSLFVEVGSTEREWRDGAAGQSAALSVLHAAPRNNETPLIGFGGTHYAARQTHIALSSRAAFGHIAHSREVPSLDTAMITRMKEKTGAVAAYIDRKSLPGTSVSALEEMLASTGTPVVSEGDLLCLGALLWPQYLSVVALAREKVPGGTVHLGREVPGGEPFTMEIDPVLLEEAWKTGPKELVKGLDGLPIIWISGPKKAVYPVFITIRENCTRLRHDLISLCVYILRRGNNTAIAGEHLIVRRRKFDPDRARELGVPQGPLFGMLMSGSPVQAGGQVITPEMVQTCTETRIHIPGLEKYL